jgi:hypothetical protein
MVKKEKTTEVHGVFGINLVFPPCNSVYSVVVILKSTTTNGIHGI